MSSRDVLHLIKEKEVKWADLRFTDTRGKEQHVSIPSRYVTEEFFVEGKMFDGSSIAGWKGINESDMILLPDATTAVLDPFFEEATVNIRCDIIEPATMQGYERDPRSLGKRAEAYLKSTGIADTALFGPENEFFIFRQRALEFGPAQRLLRDRLDPGQLEFQYPVRRGQQGSPAGCQGRLLPGAARRCLPGYPRRHVLACEEMGLEVEVHHHEVATGGQCEIGIEAPTPGQEGRRAA
jgi:glutamine synthetase